jgi:hypothetical protein
LVSIFTLPTLMMHGQKQIKTKMITEDNYLDPIKPVNNKAI